MTTEILLAGFGGQGILFAGKILAYCGLMDNKELSWLPSYGPEMRGGTCNCSVCISDTPIGSPLVLTPDILVALFIMTMFGRGVSKLLVVFTIIGCVTYIRTVRAEVLTVKQMEYVDAARVIGIPNILIIAKHVLPNVMTTVIVISTMKVGGLILAEATLSFLGAGVPVTEPSLGMLVKNGFDVLFSGYWWIAVMPGLYIMLIVFGINLLGDFLRDEFNPKLK